MVELRHLIYSFESHMFVNAKKILILLVDFKLNYRVMNLIKRKITLMLSLFLHAGIFANLFLRTRRQDLFHCSKCQTMINFWWGKEILQTTEHGVNMNGLELLFSDILS